MNERLNRLREAMAGDGVDAYVCVNCDFHLSEYVCAHFKLIRYLTGFTGSNGALVIGRDSARLFTDARYGLQARNEVRGADVDVVVCDNASAMVDYLVTLNVERVAGDGRALAAGLVLRIKAALPNVRLELSSDLIHPLWQERPPLPHSNAFSLNTTGMSAHDKLASIRACMKDSGANAHLLCTLDDIAWLFNIRGGDDMFTPLALCFAFIGIDYAVLFMDKSKLNSDTMHALEKEKVKIEPYLNVFDFVKSLNNDHHVMLDIERLSFCLYDEVSKRANIIERENPSVMLKAVKNYTELCSMRLCHEKDAVAVCKLIYNIYSTSVKLCESDIALMADRLRSAQPGFISPSFATIAAFAENAAIIHYTPASGKDKTIQGDGLLLIDSGGQYLDGTTDITRTLPIGRIKPEQKRAYTLVLKALLALSNCVFPLGCPATKLDAICRAPLWANGFDYAHGTGHGIGFVLCVHEPGVSLRYNAKHSTAIMPGMTLSIEPGIYVEGEFGVRLENIVAVESAGDGFLRFDTLTLVPFDTDAIDKGLMSDDEKRRLNAYHQRVYSTISPHLAENERILLKKQTREI